MLHLQSGVRRTPLFWLLVALLSAGCQEATTDVSDTATTVQRAMAIEQREECHLCGMIIEQQPGPKGQLYESGEASPRKFCSTRDLFAYLLDPERSHRIESVFVHDMALTPWEHPDEETYVDAREAWFVVGSRRRGSMGPTLASFADPSLAEAFAEEFGGRLYRFEEIDLELLSTMGM